MEQKKRTPQINAEGMDMLEQMILKPRPPSVTKTHEELVWDECKRHILLCIYQNFEVR